MTAESQFLQFTLIAFVLAFLNNFKQSLEQKLFLYLFASAGFLYTFLPQLLHAFSIAYPSSTQYSVFVVSLMTSNSNTNCTTYTKPAYYTERLRGQIRNAR